MRSTHASLIDSGTHFGVDPLCDVISSSNCFGISFLFPLLLPSMDDDLDDDDETDKVGLWNDDEGEEVD